MQEQKSAAGQVLLPASRARDWGRKLLRHLTYDVGTSPKRHAVHYLLCTCNVLLRTYRGPPMVLYVPRDNTQQEASVVAGRKKRHRCLRAASLNSVQVCD